MCKVVADGYAGRRIQVDTDLDEVDEQLDILGNRITSESITESMSTPVSTQVTSMASVLRATRED